MAGWVPPMPANIKQVEATAGIANPRKEVASDVAARDVAIAESREARSDQGADSKGT